MPSPGAGALARGKDELSRGDFKAAALSLSAAVRELRYDRGRDKEAADAYLHLGLAQVELKQVAAARSQFVQALLRDPSLTLDPKSASPEAVKAFDAARKQGVAEGVLGEPRSGSKGKTIALVAGGAAAVVGGALAVAGSASGETTDTAAPRPSYVPGPGGLNPYVQLYSTNPAPANTTLPVGTAITWGVQVDNPGTAGDYEELMLRAEALGADGRPCLAAERGPFSFRPVIRHQYVVPLQVLCPAPFRTDTLVVALELPGTRQRVHQTVYLGVYRVGQ